MNIPGLIPGIGGGGSRALLTSIFGPDICSFTCTEKRKDLVKGVKYEQCNRFQSNHDYIPLNS